MYVTCPIWVPACIFIKRELQKIFVHSRNAQTEMMSPSPPVGQSVGPSYSKSGEQHTQQKHSFNTRTKAPTTHHVLELDADDTFLHLFPASGATFEVGDEGNENREKIQDGRRDVMEPLSELSSRSSSLLDVAVSQRQSSGSRPGVREAPLLRTCRKRGRRVSNDQGKEGR